ncbi:MAG: VOC family protein [Rhodospirillales bacterium]|nr:VOC family protein [Rhodospirillales bacterium]
MMIFDHIGLFVADLREGRQHLSALIPIVDFTEPADDPKLKVRVQFGTDSSGIRYELVAPFGDGNPVSAVLDAGKNILNHVAYTASDLNGEIDRLRDVGAIPLGPPAPAVAFAGARVIFLLTPLGFIIELIEAAA